MTLATHKHPERPVSEIGGNGQFSTFWVAGHLYGFDVRKVQEVVKPIIMTTVPLAPGFVKGLVNLRGQVATAIGMRELLGLPSSEGEQMNVVVRYEGQLLSFLVDEIGDVVELAQGDFAETPQTVPAQVKKFMVGVYTLPKTLVSILDVDTIVKFMDSTQI